MNNRLCYYELHKVFGWSFSDMTQSLFIQLFKTLDKVQDIDLQHPSLEHSLNVHTHDTNLAPSHMSSLCTRDS